MDFEEAMMARANPVFDEPLKEKKESKTMKDAKASLI